MNEAPARNRDRAMPASGMTATAQAVVVVLTGVVVLAASAGLAWSFRAWREGRAASGGPDGPAAASAPASASASVSVRGSDGAGRQAVLLGTGRVAYQVHCVRCHGVQGHGDGSDAERLVPPPRDFASDRWRFAPTADAVRQVIVNGIPGTAMPGWGASLAPREQEGLVAYVLTLASPGAVQHLEGRDGSLSLPLPAALGAVLKCAGFTPLAAPRPAPPLVVRDLDGKTTTLAERRGRPVLVVFWGTTCAHCLSEIPAVAQFAARQRSLGRTLDLLPICVDEADPEVVRATAGALAESQPLYVDTTATARLQYDVQSLPSFALIDRAGRLLAHSAGTRDWTGEAIDDLVKSLNKIEM